MSDTYTPTTEEVRDAYANFFEGHRAIARRRAFKRWLDAYAAQVRAEALRTAAERVRSIHGGTSLASEYHHDYADWLIEEADRIAPPPVHDEGEKRDA